MPDVFSGDTPLNAKLVDDKDSFSVPDVEEKDKPSQTEIDANKAKWGYTA